MHILVVDDETDVQYLFTQRFRREIRSGSLRFSFAHSGEEACLFLNENFSDIMLVLSDINMPGMNGLELLRTIRNRYQTTPLKMMIISAYNDSENYRQAMQLGADAYLCKPLDFSILREKFQTVSN